jgi:lysozyme
MSVTVLTGCSYTHLKEHLSETSAAPAVVEKNAVAIPVDEHPPEGLVWIPVGQVDIVDKQQPLLKEWNSNEIHQDNPDSAATFPSIVVANKEFYRPLIEQASAEFGLDADLLHAMVYVESRYQPKAVSPKGAIGLLQVMPATGKRFGINDLTDPQHNLRAGASYMKWLMKHFNNDLTLALAAYNAGENTVQRYGRQIPPYPETQRYVKKVLTYYQQQSNATQTGLSSVVPPVGEEDNKAKSVKASSKELVGKLLGLLFSSPNKVVTAL